MDSSQVTRRQARIVKGQIEPTRDYLTSLRQRMAKRGFSQGDELFDLVRSAELALHALCVDLLIRTNDGPTSLPEKETQSPLESKSKREYHRRLRDSRKLC